MAALSAYLESDRKWDFVNGGEASGPPGQLTIGPVAIRCQVQKQQRIDPFSSDFFDQFFSQGLAGVVTRDLRTKPISVTARALPSDGKPAGFTGAVGRFRIKADVRHLTLRAQFRSSPGSGRQCDFGRSGRNESGRSDNCRYRRSAERACRCYG